MAILVGQLSAVVRVNKRSSQENDREKSWQTCRNIWQAIHVTQVMRTFG